MTLSIIVFVDLLGNIIEHNFDFLGIKELQDIFYSRIENNIIVSSNNIYKSSQKILKNLPKNIIKFIISSNESEDEQSSGGLKDLDNLIKSCPNKDVYFIGGSNVINTFINLCNKVYCIKLKSHKTGEHKFKDLNEKWIISSCSDNELNDTNNILYNLVCYTKNEEYMHPENEYIEYLKNPSKLKIFYFELSQHLPLFTTKKINSRQILINVLDVLQAEEFDKNLKNFTYIDKGELFISLEQNEFIVSIDKQDAYTLPEIIAFWSLFVKILYINLTNINLIFIIKSGYIEVSDEITKILETKPKPLPLFYVNEIVKQKDIKDFYLYDFVFISN